jgi:hypothetical protein
MTHFDHIYNIEFLNLSNDKIITKLYFGDNNKIHTYTSDSNNNIININLPSFTKSGKVKFTYIFDHISDNFTNKCFKFKLNGLKFKQIELYKNIKFDHDEKYFNVTKNNLNSIVLHKPSYMFLFEDKKLILNETNTLISNETNTSSVNLSHDATQTVWFSELMKYLNQSFTETFIIDKNELNLTGLTKFDYFNYIEIAQIKNNKTVRLSPETVIKLLPLSKTTLKINNDTVFDDNGYCKLEIELPNNKNNMFHYMQEFVLKKISNEFNLYQW